MAACGTKGPPVTPSCVKNIKALPLRAQDLQEHPQRLRAHLSPVVLEVPPLAWDSGCRAIWTHAANARQGACQEDHRVVTPAAARAGLSGTRAAPLRAPDMLQGPCPGRPDTAGLFWAPSPAAVCAGLQGTPAAPVRAPAPRRAGGPRPAAALLHPGHARVQRVSLPQPASACHASPAEHAACGPHCPAWFSLPGITYCVCRLQTSLSGRPQ